MPERLEQLPSDLCHLIFAALLDARSICRAARVCRAWRVLIEAAGPALWRRQIAHDFPLFAEAIEAAHNTDARDDAADDDTPLYAGPSAPTSPWTAAAWHQIVSGSASIKAQVLNQRLRVGLFGCAHWCTATYCAGLAGLALPPAQLRAQRTPLRLRELDAWPSKQDLGIVPAARVRVATGSSDFQPLSAAELRALRPGQVVELQWKRTLSSPRFNWWFALVHEVCPGGESAGARAEGDGSVGAVERDASVGTRGRTLAVDRARHSHGCGATGEARDGAASAAGAPCARCTGGSSGQAETGGRPTDAGPCGLLRPRVPSVPSGRTGRTGEVLPLPPAHAAGDGARALGASGDGGVACGVDGTCKSGGAEDPDPDSIRTAARRAAAEDADSIVLCFPQYSSTPHGSGLALTGLERVYRTRTTTMHGGVAGGLRTVTDAQRSQWLECLAGSSHDFAYVPVHPAAPPSPTATAVASAAGGADGEARAASAEACAAAAATTGSDALRGAAWCVSGCGAVVHAAGSSADAERQRGPVSRLELDTSSELDAIRAAFQKGYPRHGAQAERVRAAACGAREGSDALSMRSVRMLGMLNLR